MSDVYTCIEGGFLGEKIEDLPAERWLDEALDGLYAIDEFLVGPINQAVADSDGSVTYAEFGRLVYWAENMKMAVEILADHVAEIRRNLPEFMIKDESREAVDV
jgi:hypothetical protein